jgi:ribonuclease Y
VCSLISGRSDNSREAGGDLRLQLELKDRHIRELYEEVSLARARLGEAEARLGVAGGRIAKLEADRERLRGELRELEGREREARRQSEQRGRRISRLEREIGHLRSDLSRRDELLRRREREIEELSAESGEQLERKEAALEDALRRVDGLSRDLEDREAEIDRLRRVIDGLQEKLREEYRLRRRLAEPSNRLRAGIGLFNESECVRAVTSISKAFGEPDLYVELEEGGERLVFLTFVWREIAWQRYAVNPEPEVGEPRVYLAGAGETLPPEELPERPNAHVDARGRVALGL